VREVDGACWTLAPPSERPTSATGGSQTASISSAASRANDSSGHGSGTSHVVAPIPRLSKLVQRKSGSKNGI
jgi:hypothetical protein